jgi:hypothetical protein
MYVYVCVKASNLTSHRNDLVVVWHEDDMGLKMVPDLFFILAPCYIFSNWQYLSTIVTASITLNAHCIVTLGSCSFFWPPWSMSESLTSTWACPYLSAYSSSVSLSEFLLELLEKAVCSLEFEVSLWPTVSRSVCLGCQPGAHNQMLIDAWYWGFSCAAPSLTRGRICNLLIKLLLGLSSSVTLGPQSRRKRDHILLPHLRMTSFSVASYGSQGYSGGILTRFHTESVLSFSKSLP